MATKKKASNAKTKSSKTTVKKGNSRASFAATLEKELLQTLSKLHDNANKKLALLTKEMKKLKAKLIKTVAQKRAPLKKQLEALQKELHFTSTVNLKATALKKHLQKFEKDWIKNQKNTKKSAAKKKKRATAPKLALKHVEKPEEGHSAVTQHSSNAALATPGAPATNQDSINDSFR